MTRDLPTPRRLLLEMFQVAVRAAAPATVLPAALMDLGLAVPGEGRDRDGRLAVIAVGKAAGEMMRVALDCGLSPDAGLVVAPAGHIPESLQNALAVECITGGHPVPNADSVQAAERALAIAAGLGPQDHLLMLVSGGGSALMAAPAAGVTLADKQALTRDLLSCGATISEINGVRKHLSRVKGGRLAAATRGARISTLIMSDIPGDDPALVASGPSLPDPTALEAARAVLNRYQITPSAAILAALADERNETPKPPLAPDPRHTVRVLARARDSLDAAADCARESGYDVLDLGDDLEGEARDLGARHARLALDLAWQGRATAILSGGETTVTLLNRNGRGGPNLEYLLGAAQVLAGAPGVTALACDTDGLDGASGAAGGLIDPDTLARATRLGLDVGERLTANDAATVFAALGDLVVTGPTLTNVNDFRAFLVTPTTGRHG